MFNILVTLDSNYVKPLQTMLFSLFIHNPNRPFTIYLVYSDLQKEEIATLDSFIQKHGHDFQPIFIDKKTFSDAPVFKHYTKAMYYRLLAFQILPNTIDKILYLDPDILIINPIQSLYDTDIQDVLYAGCTHINTFVTEINKIRLNNYQGDIYLNTGVLLLNLKKQREEVKIKDIFNYIKENEIRLILPDQDILYGLYSTKIKLLEECYYNYDVRKYNYFLLKSNGNRNIDWMLQYTVVLHYCGKNKPWHRKQYVNKFDVLYKAYEKHAFQNQ